MSEQQHHQRRGGSEAEQVEQVHRPAGQGEGFDDLLDEIDELLQNDAADYVRSFVQKGGQ